MNCPKHPVCFQERLWSRAARSAYRNRLCFRDWPILLPTYFQDTYPRPYHGPVIRAAAREFIRSQESRRSGDRRRFGNVITSIHLSSLCMYQRCLTDLLYCDRGAMIAGGLAANGAKVYLCGRRKEVLENFAASQKGGKGSIIP